MDPQSPVTPLSLEPVPEAKKVSKWKRIGISALVLVVVLLVVFYLIGKSVQEVSPAERSAPVSFRDSPITTSIAQLIEPFKSLEEVAGGGLGRAGTLAHVGYLREGDAIYFYNGEESLPVVGANVETFKQYDATPYAQDSAKVYYAGAPSSVDAVTFVAYKNTAYSKDKNGAYFYSQPIERSDAATFEALNSHYAKDARSIFFHQNLFGGDQATFRLRPDGLAEDRAGLYCADNSSPRLIKDLNPDDFRIIVRNEFLWLAADTQSVYDLHNCWLVSVNDGTVPDPKTLTVMGNFARDAQHVFFFGDPAAILRSDPKTIPDVEPASFIQTFRAVRGEGENAEIIIGAEDAIYRMEFRFRNSDNSFAWKYTRQAK